MSEVGLKLSKKKKKIKKKKSNLMSENPIKGRKSVAEINYNLVRIPK